MTVIVSSQTAPELALPAFDARALARRAVLPALLALAATAALLLASSHVHALAEGISRSLSVDPRWAIVAVSLECLSLAGYVVLLSLVAGRAAPKIGVRESTQITLAGAAATRLLPTAGAGGIALALWALRAAGLRSSAAARTLLCFLVLLYSVFLAAIVLAGGAIALGLVGTGAPAELSAVPASAAALAIALCLSLALRRGGEPHADQREGQAAAGIARIAGGARLVGDAVRDALGLLDSGDLRLAGAVAYWAFDAGVLWALLHAFGASPALPAVVLAYFVGQAANTLPIPGSVSGGIAGALLAFGLGPAVALPAVLAYRTVAVWLPAPAAMCAVPALRSTVSHWRREAREAPALAG